MTPAVVIQLVLYHDSAFLPGLLKSLRAQTFTDFTVIALDNGRDDETSQIFEALWPEGELIDSEENRGFAGGHNRLLKRTLEIDPEFVVILNTDVELHPSFLNALHGCMLRFPDLNACGPLIYNGIKGERTQIIQNYRLFMNFRTARKQSPDAGKRLETENELQDFTEVDYLSGVALMLRTSIFQQMPLWDDRLFLYGEERDFFYRFAALGKPPMVTKTSVCWHFHDWTRANASSLRREYYYLRRNKILYFKKYHLFTGLSGFLLIELMRLPVMFFWALRKGGIRLFLSYWLGIWHGIKGKKGRYHKV